MIMSSHWATRQVDQVPHADVRRDRVPCLSSKITIATGSASIVREPEGLKVRVLSFYMNEFRGAVRMD
jgi:hypothetical protein